MAIYEKFIRILVLIIIGGLLTGRVYSAEIKIGWVDMQKVLNECNAGKEAKKVLTQEVEKFQRQVAEKQKEIYRISFEFSRDGVRTSRMSSIRSGLRWKGTSQVAL